MAVKRVVLALLLVASIARAESGRTPASSAAEGQRGAIEGPADTSSRLSDANAAAAAGDWAQVAILVDPLISSQVSSTDLAEAHRLAGIASFFQQRLGDSEAHFVAYLKIDLDGQLDSTLYHPDVVLFFNEVRAKHQAELRALRPKSRSYWLLNFIPPGGQLQNGERTKAIVIGAALGAFAIGNLTSYFVLRSWCERVSGQAGESATCDQDTDRVSTAGKLRTLNIVTGIGLIVTYAFGVYDGVSGYQRQRKKESLQPFVSSSVEGATVGISGTF